MGVVLWVEQLYDACVMLSIIKEAVVVRTIIGRDGFNDFLSQHPTHHCTHWTQLGHTPPEQTQSMQITTRGYIYTITQTVKQQ